MPGNWTTWSQFGKIQPNLTPLHMDLLNFLDLTVRYRIMNVAFYSNFEYHRVLVVKAKTVTRLKKRDIRKTKP